MVTEECNLLRTFYTFAGKKATKTKITVQQDKNVILIKRKTESKKTPIKYRSYWVRYKNTDRTKKDGKT
jgi:hypothetical protein